MQVSNVEMMQVAIRVDASSQIGAGHVMRCLTLAQAFRNKGVEVIFICREHPGNLCDYIESEGFKLYRLPMHGLVKSAQSVFNNDKKPPNASWLGISWQKDAKETIDILVQQRVDYLVVDHFGIDASWEQRVKEIASVKITVVDGQLDRSHDCEFLLDPNLSERTPQCWKSLVPSYCQLFLGPQFTFLRPEYLKERSRLRTRDGKVKRILIAFGGVDKANATGMALEAVKKAEHFNLAIDVVAGPGNPHKSDLERICQFLSNANFHFQPSSLAKLMAAADLSIGASGTMAWERCYLGLPAIIMSIADNQNNICEILEKKGAAIYLGKQGKVRIRSIVDAINFALNNPELLRKMSRQSLEIMGALKISGPDVFCEAILQ